MYGIFPIFPHIWPKIYGRYTVYGSYGLVYPAKTSKICLPYSDIEGIQNARNSFSGGFRRFLVFGCQTKSVGYREMSNEKRAPGCLGYIGDCTTQ